MARAPAKDGCQHAPHMAHGRHKKAIYRLDMSQAIGSFFLGIVVHEGGATEAELRGVLLSRSRGVTRQSSTHISERGSRPHHAMLSRTAEDVTVKPPPRPSRSYPGMRKLAEVSSIRLCRMNDSQGL